MISVRNLTKYYDDFLAVDDLSFEIDEGHVYGFLGPNGAGKSTTMNIIAGCLSATEGSVLIGGHDILEEPEAAKRLIGYLPEQPPLYMNETPEEYLRFVGESKGVKGQELKRQIHDVIARTGIEKVRHQLISTLSKGYKQRVGIAQALLGNPGVIILDEPTVGLDPIQIVEIRDLIKSLGETHTVIFSSHILSEVRAICEQVLIISKGKLVAFDTPGNLETQLAESNEIHLAAEGTPEEVSTVMDSLDNIGTWTVTDMQDGSVSVCLKTEGASPRTVGCRLFSAFAQKGLPIFEMTAKHANLEDVFIELTEQDMPEESDITPASNDDSTEETGKEEQL